MQPERSTIEEAAYRRRDRVTLANGLRGADLLGLRGFVAGDASIIASVGPTERFSSAPASRRGFFHRLAATAAAHERHAAYLRLLVGKLRVPTYAAWKARIEKVEASRPWRLEVHARN
jgi:hypothetical protein